VFLLFLEKYKAGNKYTCIPALFVDSMSSYISVQKKICILSKTFLHQIFDSLPFSSSGERKTSTSSVSLWRKQGIHFSYLREGNKIYNLQSWGEKPNFLRFLPQHIIEFKISKSQHSTPAKKIKG